MSGHRPDDLWRDVPKTATEFEKRFATEDDCRAYWIEARWGGKPACARCKSQRLWPEREGFLFECGECGKHLQPYLDEFAFRHNRRKTKGVGRIASRVIQNLVERQPVTMRKLIDNTRRCRWFASDHAAA